jgi:hypothetical protein
MSTWKGSIERVCRMLEEVRESDRLVHIYASEIRVVWSKQLAIPALRYLLRALCNTSVSQAVKQRSSKSCK